MTKDCETCKHRGTKLGMGQPCENCVQSTFLNWTPREKEMDDKSKHSVLKIYQFPKGFSSRTIALYPNKMFSGWIMPVNTIEVLSSYPKLIYGLKDTPCSRLAQECSDGKHEQYCTWRRENTEKPKLEDEFGHNILKIYYFPTRKTEFVAIYKGRRFHSWPSNSGMKTKFVLSYTTSEPALISHWQHVDWGQLAQECWDGKHERYCVWKRENTTKENPFWIVWNPTNPPMNRFSSPEEAENEASRLAKGSSWNDTWYVAQVESHFQRQEVVKTEYKKD